MIIPEMCILRTKITYFNVLILTTILSSICTLLTLIIVTFRHPLQVYLKVLIIIKVSTSYQGRITPPPPPPNFFLLHKLLY